MDLVLKNTGSGLGWHFSSQLSPPGCVIEGQYLPLEATLLI